MKKSLSFLFVLIHFCFSYAQTSIWEISKNGNTLYLGGSVHILRATDYPLPPEYANVYKKAETLVFETDIKKLEDPVFAQKLMMGAMYTDERTLQSVLSAKTYQELETECKKVELPIANLSKFKPSMVVLLITVTKMKQLGINEDGVDKYFYNKAIKNHKKTIGLETAEKQLTLLTNMGSGNEEEFVKHSLKDFKKLDKELSSLIGAWKNGNAKEMNKELKEMKTQFPELYKSMLVERNQNWLAQIEEMLTNEIIEFVLVGTLHLHGTDGLLTLLKKEGYEVQQVYL